MKDKSLRPLYILLFFSVFIRIFLFLFYPAPQWWDSGVYVGMGKFIYSLGENGLWEHIRPPLLSFFLGLMWFLGFEAKSSAFLLELIFSTGCIILTYFIGRYFFNDKVAFLSSTFLSFSPIFLFLGFQTYSEIPALFFALFAFFLVLKNRFLLSGIVLGLAFLTKFPIGLFLPIFIIYLLCSRKISYPIKISVGFILSTFPFFIANYLVFNNPLQSLIDANLVIKQVLGCNVLNIQPWNYYISTLFVKENFLNIFFAIGFTISLFNFKKIALMILSFILPLFYFTSMQCKDYRYVVLFLPFFLFFAAYGLYEFSKKTKYITQSLFIFYLIFSLILSLNFYFNNLSEDNDLSYISFLKNKPVKGEVWTANPLLSIYTDVKLNKIYYPVYDTKLALKFYNYLDNNKSQIQYVFLDNCGGGIICHPEDKLCKNKTNEIISFLDEKFNLIFYRFKGNCWYRIYENSINRLRSKSR